jgi:hypothetical protein
MLGQETLTKTFKAKALGDLLGGTKREQNHRPLARLHFARVGKFNHN